MFGEQIKPLEPQDKSDRRNEGGRGRRRRRGEELGTCVMWRGKRRGRPVQSEDHHTCMNASIMGWNKAPSPQNTTGINGGYDVIALIGYRMSIKHASASFVPPFNVLPAS